MTAEQLLFREAARDKIRRGIDALANAVPVTLGPRGRTVILDREFGPPQIVNSGVVVAKAIELEDRFESMGVQLLREVAVRTSEIAGDGTTTATVLAHSKIQEGLKYLAAGMNPMDLKRCIVSNAADEPSIVLHKVDESVQRSFGYDAATREYGDMLETGVIDPAKVTRLALRTPHRSRASCWPLTAWWRTRRRSPSRRMGCPASTPRCTDYRSVLRARKRAQEHAPSRRTQ